MILAQIRSFRNEGEGLNCDVCPKTARLGMRVRDIKHDFATKQIVKERE